MAEQAKGQGTTAEAVGAFTERELAFLSIHAEYFRRPPDWCAEKAFRPDSTFAPVRAWLLKGLTADFRPGSLRQACLWLHKRGEKNPTLEMLRDGYFRAIREWRESEAEAKRQARGETSAGECCRECADRGFRVLCVVADAKGRQRVVTVERPAQGTWYELLIPCGCGKGREFGEMPGSHLYREEVRQRLYGMAARTWSEKEAIRQACMGAAPVEPRGPVPDDVVAWAEAAADEMVPEGWGRKAAEVF